MRAGLGPERVTVPGDPVMHNARPVRGRDAGLLRRRDRRNWQIGEASEEQRPVEFVHPPVHRRQALPPARAQQRRMGELAMTMHDVEAVEPLAQSFQLQRVEDRWNPGGGDLPVPMLQSRKARMIADARQVCRTVRRGEQRYVYT
ncbi:protein of unknown function [Methylorubrum extorquens]|uniref:Uncharacterized protein n=1 Tax=Methylorubrum extorquens TaxID=408 RepID=A0A2N9AHB5_METEX|nr:protein of unknown function [Methylorubrum extorquens]